jgi:hypothetical protein
LAGGGEACAHFSNFPKTPQAAIARNIGIATDPRPAEDAMKGSTLDIDTLGPTCCSTEVASDPIMPIALLLPFRDCRSFDRALH